MFKIVRLPPVLEPFFRSLTTHFHWNQASYFQELVLAIAFCWGRRNIQNLYRHLNAEAHRSRYNNVLHTGRFDEASLLRQKAYELLQRIGLLSGSTIYLILDDSKKHKRGKHMEAVGWVRDCTTGQTVPGHLYVTAVLKAGEHVIPWAVGLYVKKEHAAKLGRPFRKTTEMAADMIRVFHPPADLKVVVLFDSFYLCPTVVKACRDKGFPFLSTLKDNRNLFRSGRKLKTGKYKRNAFRLRPHRKLKVAKADGDVSFTYVDAGWMEVGDVGRLHVVFSRKNNEHKIIGIVTDDPSLKPEAMLRSYAERWSVEVFFKDAKQLLGLGEYQNRPYRAAVIHLHLVCFAYALLTHLRIERARGEKGKKQKRAVRRMSTGEAQNELRRLVWKDLTQHLETHARGDDVVKELERLLIA